MDISKEREREMDKSPGQVEPPFQEWKAQILKILDREI
jgi:hypothetical protein